MTLSVVIITKNTEKKIEDCLESIKDLADEIILLDGGSFIDSKQSSIFFSVFLVIITTLRVIG